MAQLIGPEEPWLGWESLPSPLIDLGSEGIDAWTDKLQNILLEDGLATFGKGLVKAACSVVEERFGSDTTERLGRLNPFIANFINGHILSGHDGKGKRFVASYIAGLTPEQPFHDDEDYPWLADLENSRDIIVDEMQQCMYNQDMWLGASREEMMKMGAPEWKALNLAKVGVWTARDDFPKTRQVLNSLNGMRPYEINIACMSPHTTIQAHSDNMNFILGAHLGLIVPDGDHCIFTVGEFDILWKEGQGHIFDQSYVHSAVNNSSKDRYIMLIRFWHPQISEEERYGILFLLIILNSIKGRGLCNKQLFSARAGPLGQEWSSKHTGVKDANIREVQIACDET